MSKMPFFVIQAKDKFAIPAIRMYAQLCWDSGLIAQANEVIKAVTEIEQWQNEHPHLVKLPDHQHVPADSS